MQDHTAFIINTEFFYDSFKLIDSRQILHVSQQINHNRMFGVADKGCNHVYGSYGHHHVFGTPHILGRLENVECMFW